VSPIDVFLCHDSTDKPAVEDLANRLEKEGFRPFLDKWHLIPGELLQEALEEALDQSRVIVICIGKELGRWQTKEMRAAIDAHVHGGVPRIIPVLLPDSRTELPLFLRNYTGVDFRGGLADEDAFRRLVAGIRGETPGPGRSGEEGKSPRKRLKYLFAASMGVAILALLVSSWTHKRQESVRLLANQGVELMSQGHPAQAHQAFSSILTVDPENSTAHANLSWLEEQEGNYEEALSHARAAVEAASREPVHHYNLGNLLARLGRDEEAVESLRRAVELNPEFAAAHNELGNIYLRLDRPAEARQALEAGLRADPNLAPLHKNWARLALDAGKVEDAVHSLETALSLYGPNNPQGKAEALYWLAVAHARAGRRAASCSRLQQLQQVAPGAVGDWVDEATSLARKIRCEGQDRR
jgi:tetratricopeptide (TPR) repeat protein